MQIHISKWRASTSLGWLKMIWALFEHFTRRLIYYEHDSQILIAIRYSMTECYNRGSSVSIIKNKRTHVLSRLKACNYLIFRRKERSRPSFLRNIRQLSALNLYQNQYFGMYENKKVQYRLLTPTLVQWTLLVYVGFKANQKPWLPYLSNRSEKQIRRLRVLNHAQENRYRSMSSFTGK